MVNLFNEDAMINCIECRLRINKNTNCGVMVVE